ncbi:MAG: sigma-70 family RNA polymerase sigma factor [Steroidobacteraceae bacterium]|jgi:RNA polymerase sigma-70 factor (ECF subfamily)
MMDQTSAPKPSNSTRRARQPHLAELELIKAVKSCDRSLVLRAQSGERSAFNALVRRYRHRVMKLSMRYTRNRADAEDAVQNTFLKAYWGLRHFRGDAAFYSWLYRIAVNSAKTVRSLRARDASVFKPDARHDELYETSVALKELDTPEELALTDEICESVNAAIEALCEEQRTAIVLREFQGLSYSQVASAMSCPVGTVRSRVFRAREAIDDQLRRVFDDGLGRAKHNVKSQSWATGDCVG